METNHRKAFMGHGLRRRGENLSSLRSLKFSAGFTLIEMAMVVAIIGLIIGGVVAGRSLVRAAQVRDMVGEYDSYVKAIKEFQDKYHALPGDMSTAVSYWPNTANGDGSGTIGSSTTAGVLTDTAGTGGIANAKEWFLAWQHLADAGLIQGTFSGTNGAGGVKEAVIGTNVPASKVDGGGWTINYFQMTTADTGLWRDQYGHLLNFGGYVAANYTIGGILTPEEAMSIDQKLDDGMPGTGSVRAWRTSVLPSCTDETVATQVGTIYKTTGANSSSRVCSLVFLLGF